VSPPEKHPLIASTWTSESRPRAPCAALVERSRHGLEQYDESHGLSFAVFNTRVTSSRRSEVVSSHALSLLREYSASPFCPHEEPRTRQHLDSLGLPRREGPGSSMYIEARLEASRRPSTNPLGSEEPRELTSARTRPPRRRLTTPRPWPSSEDLDLERPTRSGAPRSTIDRPTRDRATPPEEPLPPSDPARHPEGCYTAPRWAPPDPSRDPLSDPSTPPRSEDHRGASISAGHPKTTEASREPASEPQDPIAAPTTPHRPEGRRSEEGGCVKALRTDRLVDGTFGDPEGSPKRAHRSPLSPQSSSPPATGLARPLRRDASRHRSPTPSSAGTRSLRHRIASGLRRTLGRRLSSPPRPLRLACALESYLSTPKGRAARSSGRLAAEVAVAERAGHLGAP